MKQYLSLFIALAAVLIGSASSTHAGIPGKPVIVTAGKQIFILSAEDLPSAPPPSPPGVESSPLTPENVQDAVEEQIAAHFRAAAGPQNPLLTADQAKAAGWGVIADYFADIDRDGDGYVRLEDVASFMKARSPLRKPHGEEHKAQTTGGPIRIVD